MNDETEYIENGFIYDTMSDLLDYREYDDYIYLTKYDEYILPNDVYSKGEDYLHFERLNFYIFDDDPLFNLVLSRKENT